MDGDIKGKKVCRKEMGKRKKKCLKSTKVYLTNGTEGYLNLRRELQGNQTGSIRFNPNARIY